VLCGACFTRPNQRSAARMRARSGDKATPDGRDQSGDSGAGEERPHGLPSLRRDDDLVTERTGTTLDLCRRAKLPAPGHAQFALKAMGPIRTWHGRDLVTSLHAIEETYTDGSQREPRPGPACRVLVCHRLTVMDLVRRPGRLIDGAEFESCSLEIGAGDGDRSSHSQADERGLCRARCNETSSLQILNCICSPQAAALPARFLRSRSSNRRRKRRSDQSSRSARGRMARPPGRNHFCSGATMQGQQKRTEYVPGHEEWLMQAP